jgi:formylglycine-generating enzyme required for sulfatase activity
MAGPDKASGERIEAAEFTPAGNEERGPRRRRNPLLIVAVVAAALFLLAMGFLLTARSVEIAVLAAAPPSVAIDGFAVPFGQRYLMRPGAYELTVTAPGYRPHEATLTVSRADTQRVEVDLEPLPGRVRFDGLPAGSAVFVDNERRGETPLPPLELAAGEHLLRVEAPRYRPLQQTIAVEGRGIEQTIALAPEPAWAGITVASEPTDAAIFLGDADAAVARTPATIEVLEGERTLLLRAPGFAERTVPLTVVAGEPRDLGTLTLTPAAGVLELSSRPAGANVTVDGEFRGRTPLTVELAPEEAHALLLALPGYRQYRDSVSLAAGESAGRAVTLEPRLGEVVFEISPADAELSIDGEPVGPGSRTVTLPTVEHRVEISRPGHATVSRRVTPREGLAQLVAVTLKTEQEARLARLPPEITTALGQTLRLFDPASAPRNEFPMGASRREPGRRANEVLHPVRLERSFYLQTTEVTNAQFRLFQESHDSGQVQGNSLNREQQPAVQVSWQQAAAFCNWLSRREDLEPFYTQEQGIITGFRPGAIGYRLPTEAEWAWVSRVNGEALQRFAWGDSFPPESPVANLADNTSAYVTGRILGGYEDGYVVSAPVGSFPPNHHGLHDLGGNVAEWVNDVYAIPPSNNIVHTDPLGAPSGDNYTIRGASWALSKLAELRLTFRDYGQRGRDDVGFRIARYAE